MLGAYRADLALYGIAHMKVALSSLATQEAWLRVSWFLLIPLLLNAFILVPVIIRRARRVIKAGLLDYSALSKRVRYAALGLETIISAYLVLTFFYNLMK
jgi:hypothetical protein